MSNLRPTHVKFKSSDKGKSYAALKSGTTWTQAKSAAKTFDADAQAKPVRRK